jgi:uncharacterized repeat protein (TIGR03806 family)
MKIIGIPLVHALLIGGMLLTQWACKKEMETLPVQVATPHPKLSDYNLFRGDLSLLQPAVGVLPYDLNTPLFTDYAEKARFVYVPSGAKAIYRENTAIEFPEGSILVKNFFYWHDARQPAAGRRLLETRLLIRQRGTWTAHNYRWNEEQTEAYYEKVGGIVPVSWIDVNGKARQVNYRIPSLTDCKGCHQLDNGVVQPIGTKAGNLNKFFVYATGTTNQLIKWTNTGILMASPAPEKAPVMPRWDDPTSGTLENRARAYLDVNCAHCHSNAGPASNSGLWLDYAEKDLTALGFCKITVAAGPGSGGLLYGIMPGRADQSILLYRMNALKAGVMMPEVGRTVIHQEGVELIRQWIDSLPPENCR